MKVAKLTVHNLGIVADAVVEFNKPLIVFYGDVRAGKSTLLNAVRWCFGGAFPGDIIRHGQTEAHVQLEGPDGAAPWVIRREWYAGKDGTNKARALTFTRNGVPVKKPVDEIAKFLNPYLLNQNHLVDMPELARARYLVELFGVDTTAEDAALATAAREAQALRAKLTGYGAIDLTPVQPVDVAALQAERAAIVAAHQQRHEAARQEHVAAVREYEAAADKARAGNQAATDRAALRKRGADKIAELTATIADLERQITAAKAKITECEAALVKYPELPPVATPPRPDLAAIEARLAETVDTAAVDAALAAAGAQNVRAQQYAANQQRAAAKAADEKQVLALEAKQREIKAAKVAKLASMAAGSKVAGLAFAEDGNFTYEGVSAGMLSTSQLMRLSQALAALYPEGFGLSLIDRGESLGKTVLTLWEDAQRREATVMVAVVGDKPATVPEQVGAYVVTEGKLL